MDLLEDETTGRNEPEFSVSEISSAVKRMIEGEFARVRIKGELGRVMVARSGHVYLDLKDERAVLSSVIWKGQAARLTVKPEEGMEVVAIGKLTTFPGQSRYQMVIEDIRPAGVGALMAMLEKRKKTLEAEGLFAADLKKPIPYLPEVIGVVTSPQGAVIRDILHRLRDRFPRKVLIWPVAVQGEGCAPQVTAAITGFNAMTPGGALPRPDLIIVARGGGSLEDLWGFNEESVARAAAGSDIPLISAVGHETDTTLIDYVSDMRAPTPTAAAELAVPVRLDLLATLDSFESRLSRSIAGQIEARHQRLRDLGRALPRTDELTATHSQRLDALTARLRPAATTAIQSKKLDFERCSSGLQKGLLTQHTLRLKARLENVSDAMGRALKARVERKASDLNKTTAMLSFSKIERDLVQKRNDTRRVVQSLSDVASRQRIGWRDKVDALDRLRKTLGYEATLERGYAVVWTGETLVTSKSEATAASELDIQFKDGRFKMAQSLSKPSTAKSKSATSTRNQGSLFDEE